jgi:repressor LexA
MEEIKALLPLTSRQNDVLKFLIKYVESNHGRAPTLAEIAKEFSISPKTASSYIDIFIKKGYIEKTPRIARGISVIVEQKEKDNA